MFNLKTLIVIVAGAVLFAGNLAYAGPVGKPAPAKSSDSYPQMYTEHMLRVMPDIEHRNELKFLGSYLDGFDNMIWWVKNLNTDTCHAYGRIGEDVRTFKSCGAAYESYRLVCKQIGNCQ